MYDEYLNHHNISFFAIKRSGTSVKVLLSSRSLIGWFIDSFSHSVIYSLIHSFL